MSPNKSKGLHTATESQIEAGKRNWAIFLLKGALSAVRSPLVKEFLSVHHIVAIEKELNDAVNFVKQEGEALKKKRK